MRTLNNGIARFFLLFGGSLRKRSSVAVRNDHSILFRSTRYKLGSWLHKRFNDKYTFIPLALLIALFLFIGVNCSLDQLAIIKFTEVPFQKNWIDQRVANAVTLFSGCLALLAWFYTNIGIREPHAYRLIFRSTYIHAAFYYIILIISLMVIISITRETLDEVLFQKLLIACHYLFILAFAFMIILFLKFKKIIDSKHILMMFGREYLEEAKQDICMEKITQTSKLFVDGMFSERAYNRLGTTLFEPTPVDGFFRMAWMDKNGDDDLDDFLNREQFEIVDINLKLLNFILRKLVGGPGGFYTPYHLGAGISAGSELFYSPNIIPARWFVQCLVNSCVLTRKRRLEAREKPETAFSVLDKKLKDYTDKNDVEHVEAILAIYNQAYLMI